MLRVILGVLVAKKIIDLDEAKKILVGLQHRVVPDKLEDAVKEIEALME